MGGVPIGAISVFGVMLFMGFARRYIRFEPPSYVTPQTLETLNRKFRVWETISIVPTLLFAVGLGFTWYYLLSWVGRAHLRSLGPSVHLLAPGDEMWMAVAIFLGILSAALPMHWLYGRLLGDDYAEYTLYTNLKYRFDTWKAFRVIAYPMGMLCILFILLGLDCYIRITPQEIVVNRFLGFGATRYSYGQVRALEIAQLFRAPDGHVVPRPYIIIGFTDGFRLTTNGTILDEEFERDAAALRYVAHRSGKPIRMVQFAEGEPS
jgi:hypothetical protein